MYAGYPEERENLNECDKHGTTSSRRETAHELGFELPEEYSLPNEEDCCGFEHLGNHSKVSIVCHTS